jgi:hypothetical protein
MSDEELTPEQVAALTAAVDIEAPPPDGEPVRWSCSARTRPPPRRSPPRGTTLARPRW